MHRIGRLVGYVNGLLNRDAGGAGLPARFSRTLPKLEKPRNKTQTSFDETNLGGITLPLSETGLVSPPFRAVGRHGWIGGSVAGVLP